MAERLDTVNVYPNSQKRLYTEIPKLPHDLIDLTRKQDAVAYH